MFDRFTRMFGSKKSGIDFHEPRRHRFGSGALDVSRREPGDFAGSRSTGRGVHFNSLAIDGAQASSDSRNATSFLHGEANPRVAKVHVGRKCLRSKEFHVGMASIKVEAGPLSIPRRHVVLFAAGKRCDLRGAAQRVVACGVERHVKVSQEYGWHTIAGVSESAWNDQEKNRKHWLHDFDSLTAQESTRLSSRPWDLNRSYFPTIRDCSMSTFGREPPVRSQLTVSAPGCVKASIILLT